MTEELRSDWPERQAKVIGQRVKALREASGMRVQSVADICTYELGYKLNRTSLNNLEAGLRKSVNVAEVAAIATAIGAAPLSLLIDLSSEKEVEIVGGTKVSPWAAWQWWAGERTFDIVDGQDSGLVFHAGSVVRSMRRVDEFVALYQDLRDNYERDEVEPEMREAARSALIEHQVLERRNIHYEIPSDVRKDAEKVLRDLRMRRQSRTDGESNV